MLVNCCYRLMAGGEVIHSLYDSDKKVILDMPEDYYKAEWLGLVDMTMIHYKNGLKLDDTSLTGYAAMCEAMLLSDKQYAIVVEFLDQGYYILEWNGTIRWKVAPTDWEDKSRPTIKPTTGNYISIGFRNTRARQLRSSCGVYKLVYNKATGLIHTNDGILTPGFDVSILSKIDYNYKGYKNMISKGYYAVVYIDGMPFFCEKTPDNILKLV